MICVRKELLAKYDPPPEEKVGAFKEHTAALRPQTLVGKQSTCRVHFDQSEGSTTGIFHCTYKLVHTVAPMTEDMSENSEMKSGGTPCKVSFQLFKCKGHAAAPRFRARTVTCRKRDTLPRRPLLWPPSAARKSVRTATLHGGWSTTTHRLN